MSEHLDISNLKALIESKEFLELQKDQSSFNVFKVLENANYEIRHSNVLAWLFRPEESHGLRKLFFKSVFDNINSKYRTQLKKEIPQEMCQITVEREEDNIDIILRADKPKVMIAFENKMRAKEGKQQLTKYYPILKSKAESEGRELHLLFLTPKGDIPNSDKNKNWLQISYQDVIIPALEEITQKLEGERKDFINMYIDTLRDSIDSSPKIKDDVNLLTNKYAEELQYFSDRILNDTDFQNELCKINTECASKHTIQALRILCTYNQDILKTGVRKCLAKRSLKPKSTWGSFINFQTPRLEHIDNLYGLSGALEYSFRCMFDTLEICCCISEKSDSTVAFVEKINQWSKKFKFLTFNGWSMGKYYYLYECQLLKRQDLSNCSLPELEEKIDKNLNTLFNDTMPALENEIIWGDSSS